MSFLTNILRRLDMETPSSKQTDLNAKNSSTVNSAFTVMSCINNPSQKDPRPEGRGGQVAHVEGPKANLRRRADLARSASEWMGCMRGSCVRLIWAIGVPQDGPVDVRAQVLASDLSARGRLDGGTALSWDLPQPRHPLAYSGRGNAQHASKAADTAHGCTCSRYWFLVHERRINHCLMVCQ